MQTLHVDDRVRLVDDIPETDLVRGRVGVICSRWQTAREPMFEVEFNSPEDHEVRRLLLRPAQLEVDQDQPVAID